MTGSKLKKEEILFLFKKTDALMNGHFELSSGLHSSGYLQCAKILQFPLYAFKVCEALAEFVKDKKIDVVIGAATGGIIISFLAAHFLKVRSVFTERKDGRLFLRRGFEIKEGERVLIVEDVVTTGGTILEMIDLIKEKKGVGVALCALVNRTRAFEKIGNLDIHSLLRIDIPAYKKEDCPLCKEKMPLLKPGSKKMK